jgi:CheY-like chemotaxis protein
MKEAKDIKVMIIDDDTFILNMYKIKFTKEGFDPTLAVNGQEALDVIRGGFIPDVVFVDLIMPIMGGIEFLENIRKENLIQNVPIMVLTNQSQVSDIDTAKNLGVKSYIVKATTIPSEIVDEVKKLFNLK